LSRRRRLQPPAAEWVRKGEDSASKWGTGRMNSDKAARAELVRASRARAGEDGWISVRASKAQGRECSAPPGPWCLPRESARTLAAAASPQSPAAGRPTAQGQGSTNRAIVITPLLYLGTSRAMSLSESLSRDVRETRSEAGEHLGRANPKPQTPEPNPQIHTSQHQNLLAFPAGPPIPNISGFSAAIPHDPTIVIPRDLKAQTCC
jgi:hypothetical protein